MQNIDQNKILLSHSQYENGKFGNEKVGIKKRACYCFEDIIKIEDFDFDNILFVEKSYENILICDDSYKTLKKSKLT